MFKRLSCVLFLVIFSSSALAQSVMPKPAAPIIGAKSYLVIDAQTGKVLAEHDADTPLAPASLTKIMTAYVIFNALQEGQVTLDDEVTISEKAWRMQGSRMFIEVGKKVRVEDLLLGVIVQSGMPSAGNITSATCMTSQPATR